MKIYSIVSIVAFSFLSSCGDEGATTSSFTQIERLGRPAINEGLVLTNDYLTAFNSIPPSSDLSSDAGVTAVRTEAAAVLTAVAAVGEAATLIPYTDPVTSETGVTKAQHVQKVVNGFLPDVLRINIDVALLPADTSYANTTSGCIGVITAEGVKGIILSCGRKIKDDVIDITYNYLAGGVPKVLAPHAALTDGIAYADHHTDTTTTFPYLPQPR
jgi:Domain of unknown function (DUF4331)